MVGTSKSGNAVVGLSSTGVAVYGYTESSTLPGLNVRNLNGTAVVGRGAHQDVQQRRHEEQDQGEVPKYRKKSEA